MGVYLTGFYNIAWSMTLSLVASNTPGATKKSFVSASIAIAHGNIFLQISTQTILDTYLYISNLREIGVGGLVGPQFFLESQKPHYQLGLGAMIVSLIMMAVCGAIYGSVPFSCFSLAFELHRPYHLSYYRTLCIYQNKARDNLGETVSPLPAECYSTEEDADRESDDKTDHEMHTFRYTY